MTYAADRTPAATPKVGLIRSTAPAVVLETSARKQGLGFDCVVRIEPSASFPLMGFSALRGAVSQAVADLEAANSRILPQVATEIVWLVPSFKSRPWAANALDLEEIALPPSRRRLHKESEIIQRVIFGLVRLLRSWCRTMDRGQILLHFYGLDEMDEQSIRLFRTLAGIELGEEITLLGSLNDANVAPQAPPMGPMAEFIDVPKLRARMMSDIVAMVRPVTLEVLPEMSAVDGQYPVVAVPPNDQALPLGTEEARTYTAFRRRFDEPARLGLGRAACEAVAASVFTLNFSQALDIVAELGAQAEAFSLDDRHELALQLGFAHAFSTDFDMARKALELSVKYARHPRQVAVSHFHLALVHVKRFKSPVEGRRHIDIALALLDPTSEPDANEMAWLQNLRALSFVEQRDFAGAGRCLQAAIRHNASVPRSSDQVHLKLNLLNNISLLEELTGDYARAIRRYASLEPLMASASSNAAKHWHYRLGGLLVRHGNLKKGLENLIAADLCARDSQDLYYCARISADIAAVQTAIGDTDAAASWRVRTTTLSALLEGRAEDQTVLESGCPKADSVTDTGAPASGLLSGEAPPTSPAKVKTRLNQPFDRINLYQIRAA